ncbi:uncharacterized protein LOC132203491 [Neocloeon triangulifer]|uniref:uncharacterized protein LOC132203491 n=1 Tax=Neocloeon triangulifer TaxID=2078957 RepID=UPI00286F4C02|nr:uncharacterized protein LOC132203491 [Neocloeon triangulifer]
MGRFFILKLLASIFILTLSSATPRHHRVARAYGYVPPYLPGLNRVTSDPSVRYEELTLDETRMMHNSPTPSTPIFDWNAQDVGYFNKVSTVARGEKGMSTPWLYFHRHRPQFHTRSSRMYGNNNDFP